MSRKRTRMGMLAVMLAGTLFPAVAQVAGTTSAGCWDAWRMSTPPEQLLSTMRADYASDLQALPEMNRELRKAVTADWEELHSDLLENLEEEHFLFGTPLNALLDSTTDALVQANPDLVRPRVLLSWYPWPNASSRGEGTLVVDMGLLARARTRSELAFVLAHELAHHHLEHVGRSITEVNERMLSREFQREVLAAKRLEYNRVARMEELLIGFSVDARRHSRNHEHEADSLGLVFLRRTAFDPAAAVSTMDMLDQCDLEVDTADVDARWAFDHPGIAYDPAWSRKEQFSSLVAVDIRDHELEDSLKTHPDCMKRKHALEAMLADATPTSWEAEVSRYAPHAHEASLVLVESAFLEEDVGRAIYLALQLLKSDTASAYLNASLARGFSELNLHSGRHTMSAVLDQPSRNDTKNYGHLLQMLQRMRRSDLAGLAAYYLDRARACDPRCEETVFAGALCAYAQGNSSDLERAKAEYGQAFPEGRHKKELDNLTLLAPARR